MRLELVPGNTLRSGLSTLGCSVVVEFGGLPHFGLHLQPITVYYLWLVIA
jgi:hypothetical protein